jgi:hypothetical protein
LSLLMEREDGAVKWRNSAQTSIYSWLVMGLTELRWLNTEIGWAGSTSPPCTSTESTLYFHRRSVEDNWISVYKATLPNHGPISIESVIVERVTPPGFHAFTPATSPGNKKFIAVATRRWRALQLPNKIRSGLSRVYPGRPGSGSTRRVNRVSPGQIPRCFLLKPGSAGSRVDPPGRAGPGFKTMVCRVIEVHWIWQCLNIKKNYHLKVFLKKYVIILLVI